MKLNNRTAKIVLAAALAIAAQSTYAQKHIEIGVTGGLSAPLGNFGKGDYDDLKSGFSKTGYNIGLTGSYFFNSQWGLTASLNHQGYGYKNAVGMAAGFKEAFDLDDATFTTDGKNQTYNFLLGPQYRIPLAKNFSFNARVLVGLSYARLAGYSVELEDVSTIYQKTSKKAAFAIQPGIAFTYSITPHVDLSAGVDYFYAKPDFTVENENRNNNAGRLLTAYNEPFQALNANLTLSYRF